MEGGFDILRKCIDALEANHLWRNKILAEPQLSKRNLRPAFHANSRRAILSRQTDFLAYADGQHDLLDIAERIGLPVEECALIASTLQSAGIVEKLGSDVARSDRN